MIQNKDGACSQETLGLVHTTLLDYGIKWKTLKNKEQQQEQNKTKRNMQIVLIPIYTWIQHAVNKIAYNTPFKSIFDK